MKSRIYPCNRVPRSKRCVNKIKRKTCPLLNKIEIDNESIRTRCKMFLREKLGCPLGGVLISNGIKILKLINQDEQTRGLKKLFPGWNIL